LELLQSRWDRTVLDWAIALADDLLAYFGDPQAGGFFFTAHDHEALIHRPKALMDDSMPAGNGVAAFALNRLGHWLGELRYCEAAERAIKAATAAMADYPQGYGATLIALDEWARPAQTVVIRGAEPGVAAWRQVAQAGFLPGRACLSIPEDETDLLGLLGERKARPGHIIAYVCEATACLPPVESLEDLRRLLDHPPTEQSGETA
jgi:uncharacterized protein YyaL (SSP411 family)